MSSYANSSSNKSGVMRPKSSAQASRERERLKDVDTSYSKNRNSFASKDYRDTYRSYLNDNYRNSGFFSDNSSMNSIFWGYIIGDMIGDSFRSAHYNDKFNQLDQKQKELFYNIREGRTPIYMIEVRTKDGSTRQISVTKEQYDRIREGDEIKIKDGKLTLISGEGKKLEDAKKAEEAKKIEEAKKAEEAKKNENK